YLVQLRTYFFALPNSFLSAPGILKFDDP
ncbi:hypothetical protein BMETH_56316581745281, partial [methanotrophic bacterial endosymbiont of Bathymodiolus sp.]